MIQRTSRLLLVILASLGLWGCTAADSSNHLSTSNSGSIGLALSETCEYGSDPQCISVGSQHVLQPSGFEEAAVENATERSDEQENSIDITFTDEGAKTLNDLTTQAMDAGTDTRLLLKAGDEILAAISVQSPISGDQATLALSPEDDADAIIERIQQGN